MLPVNSTHRSGRKGVRPGPRPTGRGSAPVGSGQACRRAAARSVDQLELLASHRSPSGGADRHDQLGVPRTGQSPAMGRSTGRHGERQGQPHRAGAGERAGALLAELGPLVMIRRSAVGCWCVVLSHQRAAGRRPPSRLGLYRPNCSSRLESSRPGEFCRNTPGRSRADGIQLAVGHRQSH